ncbi:putative Zn-dependent protease [Parasphingopyxis lamellibrachiae]|uniref:Putative Zn-dependent protease n=2 Tax=Parasphingopyxis lamellibrachiae TaxID=680125 RepID=A0A3D9FEQ6_9SPHN|nr:putative Zn-dependent protease [Parasphingopyxis lamellibrachiae]
MFSGIQFSSPVQAQRPKAVAMTGSRSFHAVPLRLLMRASLVLLLGLVMAIRPVAAQSILRDAETEMLLNDISEPLIAAAGLEPGGFEIVLVSDPSINAFVAGGQRVFIHSGLIVAADNANEVQGVIAHEIGHVTGGHSIAIQEAAGDFAGISILSLILGAAAIAAGAPEAGLGLLSAGQRAAIGNFLAFSRSQEATTDLAGAQYLSTAGISGRGSLAFFRRLQNLEYRLNIPQDEGSYDRTHPLTRERLAILEELYQNDPAWAVETDPALEARFQRARAKLIGFISEPEQTLITYPESDTSVPARYARAYAWHKQAFADRALAEVDALLAGAPDDPFFLELRGQILLESGRPDEALEDLRTALANSRNNALIASLFGHALIATEDPDHLAEARRVLRTAVQRDNRNPFAWRRLGYIYSQEGDIARAYLATAEYATLAGSPQEALVNARQAMQGIPSGSPDWVRAQDIALIAETAIEQQDGRRRNR